MLEHATLSCATQGCYAVITLHPNDEARLRRTHETFYCAAGHGNCFRGKTPEQKRIDELERQVEFARQDGDARRAQLDELHATAQLLRDGALVCPLGCGYRAPRRLSVWWTDAGLVARFSDRVYADLSEHLRHAHNATLTTQRLIGVGG